MGGIANDAQAKRFSKEFSKDVLEHVVEFLNVGKRVTIKSIGLGAIDYSGEVGCFLLLRDSSDHEIEVQVPGFCWKPGLSDSDTVDLTIVATGLHEDDVVRRLKKARLIDRGFKP